MNEQKDTFAQVADILNSLSNSKNYQVAPRMPKGKPGKNLKSSREYRLQFINKLNDTSSAFIPYLETELKKVGGIREVKFNTISPNSSKFPSYSFKFDGKLFDIVIARGANKGENFETQTVTNLGKFFLGSSDKTLSELIELMNKENKDFAGVEIVSVKQRTGSTKKEGVPIERLGEIIGDIVLVDSMQNQWFISLKDKNGNTFSSYSGAATIFDANGTLQPKSIGAEFLRSFGVDLNKVQAGFDERKNKNIIRNKLPITKENKAELKKIFERAWGMNYFYVRKMTSGWKVFWLDRKKLDELTSNIRVTEIKYPSKKSKQISIKCEIGKQKYLVEIRNSKAGEYPNDIKFKVIP
jgi:hypothetical protein